MMIKHLDPLSGKIPKERGNGDADAEPVSC